MSIIKADIKEECQLCGKQYVGDGTYENLCAICWADVATYHTRLIGEPPKLCRGYYYENSHIVDSFIDYCEDVVETEITNILKKAAGK